MDISINSEEGKFKFRVCGILEHNGKYLFVKMNTNSFYCLPGGHVELGEDTDMAIIREMKEELDYDVKIKKLIAINQNFFYDDRDNKKFHELGFYYLVEAVDENKINTSDYVREELDKGKIQHLDFKWFDLNEMKTNDVRPNFIKDILLNNNVSIITTRD